MTTLITGAAGFIGFHMAEALLKEEEKVITFIRRGEDLRNSRKRDAAQ